MVQFRTQIHSMQVKLHEHEQREKHQAAASLSEIRNSSLKESLKGKEREELFVDSNFFDEENDSEDEDYNYKAEIDTDSDTYEEEDIPLVGP
jgi:hypothetical protein